MVVVVMGRDGTLVVGVPRNYSPVDDLAVGLFAVAHQRALLDLANLSLRELFVRRFLTVGRLARAFQCLNVLFQLLGTLPLLLLLNLQGFGLVRSRSLLLLSRHYRVLLLFLLLQLLLLFRSSTQILLSANNRNSYFATANV